MKLMQLNVWSGRLQNEISSLIDQEKPDIICLQEAISFEKDDAGMFLTIENILEKHDLRYVNMAPVFSFKLMNGIAQFGNCILSRLPILKSEVIFTNLNMRDDFDFNEHNANVRNFAHSEINIKGNLYHIITHHGYHVKEHKEGNEDTLAQMHKLGSYLDSLEGRIILTGDFNLSPDSQSMRLINQRLDNHSLIGGLKTTRTQFTRKTEVCDYIFSNNNVKVKRFWASDHLVSDHMALFLEFQT